MDDEIDETIPGIPSEFVVEGQKEFSFPFLPYAIQVKFMKTAYKTFEERRFALLESPTGTGKTLSLICSSLTWLLSHRAKTRRMWDTTKADILSTIDQLKQEEEASGDWLTIQSRIQDLNKRLPVVTVQLEFLLKFDARHLMRWLARLHDINVENFKSTPVRLEHGVEEGKILHSSESASNEEDDDVEKKIREQREELQVTPKIYYASRTHSQLSQFINELKKTKFADTTKGPAVKLTPLASRINSCVNLEVIKLKDTSAINERCGELQRETKKENRCPYAKTKRVEFLKEQILASVQDIEDIVTKGRTMGCCPYYATRLAVAEADVVVLPYNNLLHNETRKAFSLDLQESVIIIDEAHNILETISSIHSASISGQQLLGAHTLISRYYAKFHNRMAPRNADIVKLIVQCLTSIIKFLNQSYRHSNDNAPVDGIQTGSGISGRKLPFSQSRTTPNKDVLIDVTKFIIAANIEQFNIFKIIDFFNRSQLARKLIGFYRQDHSIDLSLEIEGLSEQNAEKDATLGDSATKRRKLTDKKSTFIASNRPISQSKSTCLGFLKDSNPRLRKGLVQTGFPVYTLVEFLKSLTNLSDDGKVLISQDNNDMRRSILKFVLLNPAGRFKQMTDEARSIVLAGGTMQPFDEFIELLFDPLKIGREKIEIFSCDHVIDDDQLYVATVTCNSKGRPLELSFKTKNSDEMIDEYGLVLESIDIVVPNGVICFFPSYEYEIRCYERWKSTGRIEKLRKTVYREPRQSKEIKSLFEGYSQYALDVSAEEKKYGAILFCIVGGKMSEGINFNDHLARSVVMFGLPYANITSAELQQKMSYYDRTCVAPKAGQRYYENLCIKGINQSIGRAIRHVNDYASIILVDHRYATKTAVKNGLPNWIKKSIVEFGYTGMWFARLKQFYYLAHDREARKAYEYRMRWPKAPPEDCYYKQSGND